MENKNKFDPKKNYTWEEGTKIEIPANMIGMLNNIAETTINSPEGKRVMEAVNLKNAVMALVAENVEKGVFTELPPPLDGEPQ